MHGLLSSTPTPQLPPEFMDDHDETLCQICFESKVHHVLSCAHGYCVDCYDAVKELGNGCAFCRSEAMGKSADAWETLADFDDSSAAAGHRTQPCELMR